MKLVAFIALLLVSLPTPAMATVESSGCTTEANVRWSVDLSRTIVDAAIVEVPGCPDGQEIGLQLITDEGDVPAEPLVRAAEAERAVFSLTPYDVRVEPITGVRVSLYGQGEETLEVIITQRFFNRAGNEQVGLREMTLLQIPPGAEYEVPGAPQRYRVASCADLGVGMDDSVIGEGPGTHVATAPGRHLVCYQQTNGQRPDEDTDVLGEVVARDSDSTDGGVRGGPLPLTGANAMGLVALAAALMATGGILLRRRRSLAPAR